MTDTVTVEELNELAAFADWAGVKNGKAVYVYLDQYKKLVAAAREGVAAREICARNPNADLDAAVDAFLHPNAPDRPTSPPEQEQPDRSENTDERPDCDKCNGTGKLDPSGTASRSVEELVKLEKLIEIWETRCNRNHILRPALGMTCGQLAALLRKLAEEKRKLEERVYGLEHEWSSAELEIVQQQERIEELEHEYVQACDRWVPQLEALLDDKRALLERIEELEREYDAAIARAALEGDGNV